MTSRVGVALATLECLVGRTRRNPLHGRQPQAVLALALVAGVLATSLGLEPTGQVVVDAVLVFVGAAAVTWASATAPWWLVAIVCIVAAASVSDVVLMAVGLGGAAIASLVGAERRNLPWARCLATIVAIYLFAQVDHEVFQGFSALLACGTLTLVLLAGASRRPSAVRKRVWWVLGGTVLALAAALGGLAIAAVSARAPIEQGNRLARAGLDRLNQGDITAAAESFAASARSFAQAEGDLGSALAQPARLVPVVAQYRSTGAELAEGAAEAMDRASAALARIDPATVRLRGGRIDVGAVRALQEPFADLDAAIVDLAATIEGVRGPWLVDAVDRQLTEVLADIDRNRVKLDNARLAVEVAPAMLGGDGERRYFIAFLTPTEARGLGGFMGNYAEVTIDDGLVEVTEFGRTGDLNRGGPDPEARVITGPEDLIPRWGHYGFVMEDGTAAFEVWSNISMVPDMPTVGQVIAELYPQSGGAELDGVFAMLPEAVAQLMRYTGPVVVPGVAEPITADTMVDFIERDQYALFEGSTEERVAAIESIARTTIERMLSADLPDPAQLGREWGPLGAGGQFMAWAVDEREQQLFDTIGLDGRLPPLAGGDGLAVTIDNAGANKIDAYLQVHTVYEPRIDPVTGVGTARATITLTNTVEPDGLPDYAVGNVVGLPRGTNRMLLSVFSGLPATGATLDGSPAELPRSEVFGWHAALTQIDVAAGQTRTLVVDFAGWLGSFGEPGERPSLTIRPQVMSLPQVYEVRQG